MARECSGKNQASTLWFPTALLKVQQSKVYTLFGTAKFHCDASVNLTWFRAKGQL